MSKNEHTAAIVGGGIGGLATANLLAKAGYRVEVFEARAQLGGRMGLLETNGFRFDTGPSWYLMPEVFEHYYHVLGTSARKQLKLKQLKPAYQVFLEGENQPLLISGDESLDTATFENREQGAGKALTMYLNDAEKTYKLAISNFLYTTFGKPSQFLKPSVLRYAPAMLKNAKQPIHALTSKYFSDNALRQILEYPAVFLGSSPFTAPAIYSLMSYLDFRQGVFYPEGGMYAVTQSMERLGRQLGVRYHLNQPVKAIELVGRRATGVRLKSGKLIAADVVISNADLHFTQTQLLPEHARDYPEKYWQKRRVGPSALLMYLGVKDALPELKHHNLFFAKDWKANFKTIDEANDWPEPASIYVCKPSETDSSVAPAGHENIFVLVPLPAAPELHADEKERYADRYIQQIADQAGIVNFSERIVTKQLFGPADFLTEFHAWEGTALGLAHELRQSAMFRPRTRSKKTNNLFYVGASVQPGIGVPMCLISAELVYKQIVGDHSQGPLKAEIT